MRAFQLRQQAVTGALGLDCTVVGHAIWIGAGLQQARLLGASAARRAATRKRVAAATQPASTYASRRRARPAASAAPGSAASAARAGARRGGRGGRAAASFVGWPRVGATRGSVEHQNASAYPNPPHELPSHPSHDSAPTPAERPGGHPSAAHGLHCAPFGPRRDLHSAHFLSAHFLDSASGHGCTLAQLGSSPSILASQSMSTTPFCET